MIDFPDIPWGSGFGTVSTWISSRGNVGKEFLDFPLEAAGMVIILHDVHTESLPDIICTSCHKSWALIVAMAPSDLWNLSCSRLVLSFSFLILALLLSSDFLSFFLVINN